MRILVTGASGFSGSYIAAALAREGFNVTGIYRRTPGFAAAYEGLKGLTLLRADLATKLDLPGPFNTIVHTAASSPAPGVHDADMVHDNTAATHRLAATAEHMGCKRFIYFSSLSIYGEISVPVVDETTPIVKPDVYGKTKWEGEQALSTHAENVPAITLRLPGVIGPGAHRNWLSNVAATLHAGMPVRAFNLDRPFNNACHVSDLARLVMELTSRAWQGFDAIVLGARGETTVRGAIERLAAAMGVNPTIEEIASPGPGFMLSSTRAIDRWGYDPMEIGAMLERYGHEASN